MLTRRMQIQAVADFLACLLDALNRYQAQGDYDLQQSIGSPASAPPTSKSA